MGIFINKITRKQARRMKQGNVLVRISFVKYFLLNNTRRRVSICSGLFAEAEVERRDAFIKPRRFLPDAENAFMHGERSFPQTRIRSVWLSI